MRNKCGNEGITFRNFLILIFSGILYSQCEAHSSQTLGSIVLQKRIPSLQVLCTHKYIRVTVVLERPDFFGVVYTRPSKHSCSVQGIGEPEIILFIPLSQPGMTECGVALQDGSYSVVIDVREHHIVETARDSTFLVQCSAETNGHSKAMREKVHPSLSVLQNDRPIRHAVIGDQYSLQLNLPNITSCLAFSGNDTIKFIPMMDKKGCPVEDLMTPFYPISGTNKVRAELTMFRFNDSTHFHIQCMINDCKKKCIKPSCRKNKDANLIGARILMQNEEEAMAAQRIVVLDPDLVSSTVRYTSCSYRTDTRLVGLTALLAMLATFTLILCITAVYNRPFRCHVLPRDGSANEELIQIVEEPSDWILTHRTRPLLALPPPPDSHSRHSHQGLLITTLPSTMKSRKSVASTLMPLRRGVAVDGLDLNQGSVSTPLSSLPTPTSAVHTEQASDVTDEQSTLRSVRKCPLVTIHKSTQSRESDDGSVNSTVSIYKGTSPRGILVGKKARKPAPPPRRCSKLSHSSSSSRGSSPPLPPPPPYIPRSGTESESGVGDTIFDAPFDFPPPPPAFTLPRLRLLGATRKAASALELHRAPDVNFMPGSPSERTSTSASTHDGDLSMSPVSVDKHCSLVSMSRPSILALHSAPNLFQESTKAKLEEKYRSLKTVFVNFATMGKRFYNSRRSSSYGMDGLSPDTH